MFGPRYFGHRYFGPRYFGDGSDTPPPEPEVTFHAHTPRRVAVLFGLLFLLLWG